MSRFYENGSIRAQIIPGDLFMLVWSNDHEGKEDRYVLEINWDGEPGWYQLESEASCVSPEADEVWSDHAFVTWATSWIAELELAARGKARWDGVVWRPNTNEEN